MRVGIVGSGALGRSIGLFLAGGAAPGLDLDCISGIDMMQVTNVAKELRVPHRTVMELIDAVDFVVEATAAAAMPGIVRAVMAAGKKILIMSVGGFAVDEELEDCIVSSQGEVFIPSGGVAGIDGLLALKEIGLDTVALTTTKSPHSLAGAPFFASGASIADPFLLTEPMNIFSGSAREAILAFPANANLAITISLAGIGFDKTRVNIIVDPSATKTTQHLEAAAGECRLQTTLQGVPHPDNPRTALAAAQSVNALLRKTASKAHIGT
jgi:aspartate dehydrogenase